MLPPRPLDRDLRGMGSYVIEPSGALHRRALARDVELRALA